MDEMRGPRGIHELKIWCLRVTIKYCTISRIVNIKNVVDNTLGIPTIEMHVIVFTCASRGQLLGSKTTIYCVKWPFGWRLSIRVPFAYLLGVVTKIVKIDFHC